MNFQKIIFLIGICCISGTLMAQGDPHGVENLPKYENEVLHFGFSLAANSTNFIIQEANMPSNDSVRSVLASPELGFNLGIISDVRLQRYLTIRFLPDLSFSQRDLTYQIDGKKDTLQWVKKVASTFLDFPIDLKLRSARYQNASAYILGGFKYIIDLASQRNATNTEDPRTQIVKLVKPDWGYEFGAGVEFYLPYFKFGIEGKLSTGINNVLVNDHTVFSNSIEQLKSKVFLLSFTFEG
ncbi:MAG: porin family protein [Bacteroidia bacterium]